MPAHDACSLCGGVDVVSMAILTVFQSDLKSSSDVLGVLGEQLLLHGCSHCFVYIAAPAVILGLTTLCCEVFPSSDFSQTYC